MFFSLVFVFFVQEAEFVQEAGFVFVFYNMAHTF